MKTIHAAALIHNKIEAAMPTGGKATAPAEKISFSEKVAYGLGDTASNLYWQTFLTFLLFFYTDVFGITAAAAGTMFLVVRTWETGIDPLMGLLADRTRTRWGRYRPYLLWGCVPMAVMGVVMFTTPQLDPRGKLIYAYVTYSLALLAYTFVNIPYSAIMGVLSPNSLERTSLASYRFVLAYGGLLIVQSFTLPLVKFLGHGNDQRGFPMTMAAFGVLAIALFLVTFTKVRERTCDVRRETRTSRADVKDLLQNRPWLMSCLVGVFAVCYFCIRMAAIVYYFKYYVTGYQFDSYFWGRHFRFSWDGGTLASLFMALGTAGVIFGAAMARPLTRLLGGKRQAFFILMMAASLLTVFFYLIPRQRVILMFVVHGLISTLFAPTSPLLWAFYADTGDYSEWKTGRRATGLVFSAASFCQKLGWAGGGALAGWLLGHFGFHANIPQPNQVQTGIRWMMSFIPAIAGFLSAATVLGYKLDDSFMVQIERELRQRSNSWTTGTQESS